MFSNKSWFKIFLFCAICFIAAKYGKNFQSQLVQNLVKQDFLWTIEMSEDSGDDDLHKILQVIKRSLSKINKIESDSGSGKKMLLFTHQTPKSAAELLRELKKIEFTTNTNHQQAWISVNFSPASENATFRDSNWSQKTSTKDPSSLEKEENRPLWRRYFYPTFKVPLEKTMSKQQYYALLDDLEEIEGVETASISDAFFQCQIFKYNTKKLFFFGVTPDELYKQITTVKQKFYKANPVNSIAQHGIEIVNQQKNNLDAKSSFHVKNIFNTYTNSNDLGELSSTNTCAYEEITRFKTYGFSYSDKNEARQPILNVKIQTGQNQTKIARDINNKLEKYGEGRIVQSKELQNRLTEIRLLAISLLVVSGFLFAKATKRQCYSHGYWIFIILFAVMDLLKDVFFKETWLTVSPFSILFWCFSYEAFNLIKKNYKRQFLHYLFNPLALLGFILFSLLAHNFSKLSWTNIYSSITMYEICTEISLAGLVWLGSSGLSGVQHTINQSRTLQGLSLCLAILFFTNISHAGSPDKDTFFATHSFSKLLIFETKVEKTKKVDLENESILKFYRLLNQFPKTGLFEIPTSNSKFVTSLSEDRSPGLLRDFYIKIISQPRYWEINNKNANPNESTEQIPDIMVDPVLFQKNYSSINIAERSQLFLSQVDPKMGAISKDLALLKELTTVEKSLSSSHIYYNQNKSPVFLMKVKGTNEEAEMQKYFTQQNINSRVSDPYLQSEELIQNEVAYISILWPILIFFIFGTLFLGDTKKTVLSTLFALTLWICQVELINLLKYFKIVDIFGTYLNSNLFLKSLTMGFLPLQLFALSNHLCKKAQADVDINHKTLGTFCKKFIISYFLLILLRVCSSPLSVFTSEYLFALAVPSAAFLTIAYRNFNELCQTWLLKAKISVWKMTKFSNSFLILFAVVSLLVSNQSFGQDSILNFKTESCRDHGYIILPFLSKSKGRELIDFKPIVTEKIAQTVPCSVVLHKSFKDELKGLQQASQKKVTHLVEWLIGFVKNNNEKLNSDARVKMRDVFADEVVDFAYITGFFEEFYGSLAITLIKIDKNGQYAVFKSSIKESSLTDGIDNLLSKIIASKMDIFTEILGKKELIPVHIKETQIENADESSKKLSEELDYFVRNHLQFPLIPGILDRRPYFRLETNQKESIYEVSISVHREGSMLFAAIHTLNKETNRVRTGWVESNITQLAKFEENVFSATLEALNKNEGFNDFLATIGRDLFIARSTNFGLWEVALLQNVGSGSFTLRARTGERHSSKQAGHNEAMYLLGGGLGWNYRKFSWVSGDFGILGDVGFSTQRSTANNKTSLIVAVSPYSQLSLRIKENIFGTCSFGFEYFIKQPEIGSSAEKLNLFAKLKFGIGISF